MLVCSISGGCGLPVGFDPYVRNNSSVPSVAFRRPATPAPARTPTHDSSNAKDYGYTNYANYAPYSANYAPPVANQYHSQDEYGQASYGYSHPGQAAVNYRDAYGNQAGSYAYIDAEGKEVSVRYIADANGFRVISNALPVNNLAAPLPVQDTPEVAAARAEHLKAHAAAAAAAAAARS